MKLQGMLMFSLILFAGCTSDFVAPPLPANHPANPQAQVTALSAPLNPFKGGTLSSPTQQEGQAEHGMAIGSAESPRAQMMSQAQQVEGEGKVVAVVPESEQIVLEHGEIKGFMGAMTMGYKVKSPSLLQGLKAGDKVRFTIDTREKTIIKIVKEQE